MVCGLAVFLQIEIALGQIRNNFAIHLSRTSVASTLTTLTSTEILGCSWACNASTAIGRKSVKRLTPNKERETRFNSQRQAWSDGFIRRI